jgi:transcriptional regulator with XRE-family HTH domain
MIMKTFKQYRRIEGIAATRVRLGLSQQEFADQLGISRSLVAKAEGRQRTLPTSTIVKIASLEILLAGANSAKVAVQPHPVEIELFE